MLGSFAPFAGYIVVGTMKCMESELSIRVFFIKFLSMGQGGLLVCPDIMQADHTKATRKYPKTVV
jgi:hypothetical protein